VRKALIGIQRSAILEPGTVAEGRDIGTVIFPDADLKVFLDAAASERTRRRSLELEARSVPAETIARVGEEMAERDRRDSTRAVAPLAKADDALVLDTTHLTFDEVVARIVGEVEKRRRSPK
jgi:cytidylate kinase